MIEIRISGSALEVLEEMQHFVRGAERRTFPVEPQSGGEVTDAGAAPAKVTRSRKKAEDKPADPPASAEGNAASSPAGSAETSTPPTTDATSAAAAPPADGPIDVDKLRADCMQLSQKAGPEALKQLLIESGSANGKWSEVKPEKYGAMRARLDDLLAG